jgi:hypothetical protein
MAALYRASGERSPIAPVRVRVVPENVEGFVAHVYAALRGVRIISSDVLPVDVLLTKSLGLGTEALIFSALCR